ncbi:sensor histidine kinase [Streptomyces millisiae]|uniref:histidine kinase n=1 Tax=Streptomyces millisiae TaxID=3075542 RepID=A0ABU2LPE4_9ACTN|nr:nitrate- and nitrite sensing domain-containing protein [Streptomyces sp. DSM 44918]MDT0319470.1 nitrate- and nitrite sensing domain-containing protein [Streptomyces sp. DSM 44918]
MLLTGVAVLGAGAPAMLGTVEDYDEARRLHERSQVAEQVVTLSHLVADERDALVAAVAAGNPGAARGEDELAHVDDAAAGLGGSLDQQTGAALAGLPAAREFAHSAEATPLATFDAYTAIVQALDGFLRATVDAAPEDADDPAADALPDLARAVDASSATRGLLLAALAGPGEQRELTTLAQRQRVREEAALADFTAVAGPRAAGAYEHALTGGGAEAAAGLLLVLTDAPVLSPEDHALDESQVHDTLLDRTRLQRGVLTDLADEHTDRVRSLRDGEVQELTFAGGALLVALVLGIGVSVGTARSLTRPLAAVRLGSSRVAADPTGQEPVKYSGRNDEFAEVVASVNALHARALSLHQHATEAAQQAAEIAQDTGGLRAERDRLLAEQNELHARLAALHGAVHGMFAHHAQRLLILTGEQLAVIEGLESQETDPDRLAVLFTVDHLAARMRRHGENLLLLAGAEPPQQLNEPMPLIDVARAAVSEIERYELVETAPAPPPVWITGVAARDLSHLLAELLDNATAYSPTGARVRLTGRWADGELLMTVEDEGLGLSQERLAELNARIADPVTPPPGAASVPEAGMGIGMGLYTVARLAARHGLRCWLRARPTGGTVAEVAVPARLVEDVTEPYPSHGTAPTLPVREPGGSGPVPIPDARTAEYARAAEHTEHAHAADTAPRFQPQPPPAHAITDSGLPRRTRGVPTPFDDPNGGRTPAVDPEELRRRLGGFQRGARDGHRDAAQAAGGYPGDFRGSAATGEEMPS